MGGPINLVGSHCVDFYGYRDAELVIPRTKKTMPLTMTQKWKLRMPSRRRGMRKPGRKRRQSRKIRTRWKKRPRRKKLLLRKRVVARRGKPPPSKPRVPRRKSKKV